MHEKILSFLVHIMAQYMIIPEFYNEWTRMNIFCFYFNFLQFFLKHKPFMYCIFKERRKERNVIVRFFPLVSSTQHRFAVGCASKTLVQHST